MYSLLVSVFGESKYIRLNEQEINDPSEFMKTGTYLEYNFILIFQLQQT